MGSYKVHISRIEDNLHASLINGLSWIDWRGMVKSDSTVFVKPNLTWPVYRPGVITSPELLRILLPILKDRVSHVILGESDLPKWTVEETLNNLRLDELCRENGVEAVNLSKQEVEFYRVNVQDKEVKVELPKLLVHDIDVFISVPVMKTHVISNVSLSLKNQWGCIPNQMRGMLYHTQLNRRIVALNKIIKPKIAIIDALYALDGRGPIFGDPVKMNLIIMSNNIVAADRIGCEIMQIPVEEVEHIDLAEKEGLGTTNLKQIVTNESPTAFTSKKFKTEKSFLDHLTSLTFKSQMIANIVFDSKATPHIYRVVNNFRTSKEKSMLADDVQPIVDVRRLENEDSIE